MYRLNSKIVKFDVNFNVMLLIVHELQSVSFSLKIKKKTHTHNNFFQIIKKAKT